MFHSIYYEQEPAIPPHHLLAPRLIMHGIGARTEVPPTCKVVKMMGEQLKSIGV